jgi:hypothetical protein
LPTSSVPYSLPLGSSRCCRHSLVTGEGD